MIITEFEKKCGLVAKNEKLLPKTSNYEEFVEHFTGHMNDFVGVMYEARISFLENNGYKLNRENLLNGELSARSKEDASSDIGPGNGK